MSLFARLARPALVRPAFVRAASTTATTAQVPSPRGKFDNPETFLQTIGRGCDKFAPKFTSWTQLFSTDSATMKSEMGIGPKQRKWILLWTNKFRLGIDPYLIPSSKKHEMTRTQR
ncbi:hypothetical protein IWW55_006947, partial [Coemansia sp. RSA 2706]